MIANKEDRLQVSSEEPKPTWSFQMVCWTVMIAVNYPRPKEAWASWSNTK